jgi:capsular exopolysaccharide synthesis family protein
LQPVDLPLELENAQMSLHDSSKPTKNALEPVAGQRPPDGGLTPGRNGGPLAPGRLGALQSLPPLAKTPDAVSLLKAFRHRWILALSLSLLVGVVAAAAAWYLFPQAKPTYRAYALLRISQVAQRIVFPTNIEDKVEYPVYRQTQAELLRSRYVLRVALSEYDRLREELLQKEPERGAKLPSLKDDDPAKEKEKKEQVVHWLESELKAEFLSGSEIMSVSLTGDNPEQVRALVDAVKIAFLKEVVDREYNEKKKQAQELENLYNTCERRMLDRMRGLREEGLPPDKKLSAEEQQRLLDEFDVYQKEVTQLEMALMRKRIEKKVYENSKNPAGKPRIAPSLVEEYVAKDPTVQNLTQELARVEKIIRKYEAIAANPEDVRDYRNQYRSLKEKLAEQQKKARIDAEKELQEKALGAEFELEQKNKTETAFLEEQKKWLNEMVDSRFKELKELKTGVLDLQLRRFEIDRLQTITKYVGDEWEAVKVELRAPKRATAIQDAEVPPPKDPHRETKTVGMVGLGAFFLVALGISLWEFRSRRIHSTEEVVQTLGIRLMGAMPALPESVRRQPVAEDNTRHIFSRNLLTESIDGIRTLVLHEAGLESARVLMVTSAEGREGKTTLACHLAASIARAGKKTLLVDADLIRPGCHKMFDQPLQPGLSELLRNQVKIPDVIRPTPAPGLWIIPAGQADRTVVQALAKDGLQKVFGRLKAEFDMIIVDSSPVLPVAQTLLIGKQSDAVVMSIMHDHSRVPPVYAAHHRLTSLGIRVLGGVFHKARADYYGYGYSGSRDYRYALPAPAKS